MDEACEECTQNCITMHKQKKNPSPVATTFFKVMFGDDYSKVLSLPDLKKRERKNLCQTLDFKKLSQEASMHAAQNEFLPLRVLLQALFFEQTRAAMTDGHITEVPGHNEALFPPDSLSTNKSTPQQSRNPSVSKSRMKVAADDDSDDNSFKVV
nr:hypothetical protein [Tanacetum cinerariifolium]